jgi:hypothetical protein
MPADGTLAARSHARISASPASRAATQNLADFTGTLYPPIGGCPSSANAIFWFADLDLVCELPAGCAEVLLVAAAPMPSAGITLRQTDNLYLAGASRIHCARPHGACA